MQLARRRMSFAILAALAINLVLFSLLSGFFGAHRLKMPEVVHRTLILRTYTPPKPQQLPQQNALSRTASAKGAAGKIPSNLSSGGESGGTGNAIIITGAGGKAGHMASSAPPVVKDKPFNIKDVFVPAVPPLPTKHLSILPVVKVPTLSKATVPNTIVSPSPKSASHETTGGPPSHPQKVASAEVSKTVQPPIEPTHDPANASPNGLSMDPIPQPGGSGKGTDVGNGTGSAGPDSGNGAGNGSGGDAGDGAGSGKKGKGRGAFGAGTESGSGGGDRHIVYVLDVSPSMDMVKMSPRRTRLEQAKSEVIDAINSLKPTESFDIVLFSSRASTYNPGLKRAEMSNVNDASLYLNDASVGEGTDIGKALLAALRIPGVNTVVLITDGVPTQGVTDPTELARMVRNANTNGARIDTVGLVGKDPDGNDMTQEGIDLLKRIAEESAGTSRLVAASHS